MRLATMLGSMAVLALAATGCSDDETGPSGHSSPVAVRLLVNDVEIDEGETLTLTAGETVEVEVFLLDEHGDVIEGIEEGHHVKLNFDPEELATSANVGERHFLKTVTAQAAPGTGTLDVGYGHSEEAEEDSFGPFDVEVVAAP